MNTSRDVVTHRSNARPRRNRADRRRRHSRSQRRRFPASRLWWRQCRPRRGAPGSGHVSGRAWHLPGGLQYDRVRAAAALLPARAPRKRRRSRALHREWQAVERREALRDARAAGRDRAACRRVGRGRPRLWLLEGLEARRCQPQPVCKAARHAHRARRVAHAAGGHHRLPGQPRRPARVDRGRARAGPEGGPTDPRRHHPRPRRRWKGAPLRFR
mmetsp:Transcript_19959/g.63583  ORF Transcript_19959/g.63583 Transcript_19959/m.63583 type:complete len:215 (+) Transcript_19959:1-645(+)